MTCRYCDLTNNNESFITESEHWKVFLSYDQCYIGHCLIVLKRHAQDINELNEEEMKDFHELIKKIEKTMKMAFGATMFNISCLMNDGYNLRPNNPHVYFNLKPRYSKPVDVSGLIFDDPEFGFHYSSSRTREVSDKVKKEIMETIKNCL